MNLSFGFALLFTLQGGRGQAPPPRTAAPIDLTGNWVSIVSEDWRLRMVVAQKGDWDVIPLNEAGRKAAEAADHKRCESAPTPAHKRASFVLPAHARLLHNRACRATLSPNG